MIRRPPRSTLFPTRRSSDLNAPGPSPRGSHFREALSGSRPARSEEHTSELQSLAYLVCRLLLEKKKKKKNKSPISKYTPNTNVSNDASSHNVTTCITLSREL